MATAVVMPKQGNSVESCIIVEWKKDVGDVVAAGETLCDVETDKAVLAVESPTDGTLLTRFFAEGDEVPVLTNIAAIGASGEDFAGLAPEGAGQAAESAQSTVPHAPAVEAVAPPAAPEREIEPPQDGDLSAISPRARALAGRKGLDTSGLIGSGPGGRVIERDVEAALDARPRLTPVARAMVAEGTYSPPASGSGPGGRIMARDLQPGQTEPAVVSTQSGADADGVSAIPVKGVRRLIAQRMLHSLQSTAQLTLHGSADAGALLAYRKRLKASAESLQLQSVTINDLVLFAVSRALTGHPEMNALFEDEVVYRYGAVHLGMAVDTPRGLLVPVIRGADRLSLRALAQESGRLATAAIEGRVLPDELNGGTFTVTNLGTFGVERFTPVLNTPQVGILGVGNINLKPIARGDDVAHVPHIGLSLTINHQVVDGAPAARFLQTLSGYIAEIDLLVAS